MDFLKKGRNCGSASMYVFVAINDGERYCLEMPSQFLTVVLISVFDLEFEMIFMIKSKSRRRVNFPRCFEVLVVDLSAFLSDFV